MSASLHVIGEGKGLPLEPSNHTEQRVDSALTELREAIRAGSPDAELDRGVDIVEYGIKSLARRARKFERALRGVLGAELSDEQLAVAFTALEGAKGRRRNPGGLSDCEYELVEGYRRMNAADRKFVRDLFDRVARTSVVD
jgi:hypothetical protein